MSYPSSSNQWAAASGELVAKSVRLELDGFGAICGSSIFSRIIQHFADYEGFLKRLNEDANQQKIIRGLLKDGGVINAAKPTPELVELFCLVQIAACCELLKGRAIPFKQLNRDGMRLLAQQIVVGVEQVAAFAQDQGESSYSEEQRNLMAVINQLLNLDTIRVTQLVRLLGLLGPNSQDVRQLSLAAGTGYRDLFGVHSVPRVSLQASSGGHVARFDLQDRQAGHTILVDNDPVYAGHYESLSAEQGDKVLALNMDAAGAYDYLKSNGERLGIGKRNLVVGLRIDHHMIPDAGEFLGSLVDVIDNSAGLFLSIGAGNDVAEFEGRVNCFDALSGVLTQAGMKPVRIKMHGEGTLEEQRAKPNFGNLEYTSYQVLYCKLLRNRLAKLAKH